MFRPYVSRAKNVSPQQNIGEIQSSEVVEFTTDSAAPSLSRAENLVFSDGLKAQDIEMGTLASGNYDQDKDTAAHLSQFLSRPVRIAYWVWAQAGWSDTTSVLPWQAYFNDPIIKNKIQNFGKIRCKLHLKFLVNGSPFHYGSMRASYFPLLSSRSNWTNSADLLPFSQTPGVYLEPQNMSTSEMTLPFLWPHNWLEVTKLTDFGRMGKLCMTQFAPLASANGATSDVSIAIYAWASEVEVMGPTTIGALQGDEYVEEVGTISGPATAVANIASRLSDAPIIGPFARATEIGARATAGIARLFGYSNPPMIDDVHAFQPKSFHAFANSETRMPLDKLCLDPKNEVTISPTVTGVDEKDPLVFSELLSRESYLDRVSWSTQPADTLLWSSIVSPHYAYLSGGFRTVPPVTYFSPNFRFWRGSIIYKFRIIKTRFHKGRILISYDPNGDISATADTETSTFSKVVDLDTEDEVEFVVPYKNTAPMALVPDITTWPATYSSSTTPTYTYNSNQFNGMITVRVQTMLSGPTTTPAISILAYVRAGDDFMYAGPTSIPQGIQLRDPAGVIQSSGVVESITQSKPGVDTAVASITTGEVVASMRPILHRTHYILSQVLGVGPVATAGFMNMANVYTRIPQGVGRTTAQPYNLATVSASSVGYVFATNNPIDWTLDCFVGVRGSTNAHVNVYASTAMKPSVSALSVARWYKTATFNATKNLNGTTGTQPWGTNPIGTLARNTTTDLFNSGAGVSYTNPTTQSAVSVNIPQYWPTRFMQAFHSDRAIDPRTGNSVYDNFVVLARGFSDVTDASTPTQWPILDLWQSAGVDFQPIFFLCTPRIFTGTIPVGVDA